MLALCGAVTPGLEAALGGGGISGLEVAMAGDEDSRGQDLIQQRTLTQMNEATATKVTRNQAGIRRKLAA